MALPTFTWGSNGEALTPEQVKRKRLVAESLASKPTPATFGAGLSRVGDALQYNALNSRADAAEQHGIESAVQSFGALTDGSGSSADIIGALSNPWVAENPGQSAIAQALLQQNMQKEDPAYQLDMQLKQAQLANASEAPERKYEKDAGGNLRYLDTGEPVFADSTEMAPAPNPKAEGDLRTEYNGINTVKDFGLQTQAYQRVLDSAKDPSPAGDLALIFNYMKVLDPGSTVREGEFATAQNSGSLPEQIMSQYNKVLSGERLVPEIRKDFVNRAGQLFKGAAGLQQGTNDRYDNLATQYGYDPNRITADIPQIGVLDPNFNIDEYLTQTPDGPVQTKPLPVTNDDDYNALPSGAVFVGPDGQTRKKP